jgi:hypothetical protein
VLLGMDEATGPFLQSPGVTQMFIWDSQCMGTTNISRCEDQTEVISDNEGY